MLSLYVLERVAILIVNFSYGKVPKVAVLGELKDEKLTTRFGRVLRIHCIQSFGFKSGLPSRAFELLDKTPKQRLLWPSLWVQ